MDRNYNWDQGLNPPEPKKEESTVYSREWARQHDKLVRQNYSGVVSKYIDVLAMTEEIDETQPRTIPPIDKMYEVICHHYAREAHDEDYDATIIRGKKW
jgi:hypothetical protein